MGNRKSKKRAKDLAAQNNAAQNNPGVPIAPGNMSNVATGAPAQPSVASQIPWWAWLNPITAAAYGIKGAINNKRAQAAADAGPQSQFGGPAAPQIPGAPEGWAGGAEIPGTTPLGLLGAPPKSSFWTGDKPQSLLFQQYFPAQQQALQETLQNSLSGLRQNFPDFGPIEENARTQFSQRTLPSILERFNAMGGERSSAFPEILGSASKDLESDLAAQRGQYNLAQNELLQRLLQIGLTPQVESVYAPRQPGFLQGLAGPVAQAAGMYFGGR